MNVNWTYLANIILTTTVYTQHEIHKAN